MPDTLWWGPSGGGFISSTTLFCHKQEQTQRNQPLAGTTRMTSDDIDFLLKVAKRANSAAYSIDCGIVVLETNDDHMLIGIYSTDDIDSDDPIGVSDCISTAKLKVHGEYAGHTMLSLTYVEDGAVERIFNASGENLVAMFYM